MNSERHEKLNEYAQDLLRADTLPDEQVEEVVAAPHLFKAVTARIANEKIARQNRAANESRVAQELHAKNGWRRVFGARVWRAVGFAAVIISGTLIWQLGAPQNKENILRYTTSNLEITDSSSPGEIAVSTSDQIYSKDSDAQIDSDTQTRERSVLPSRHWSNERQATFKIAQANKVKSERAILAASPTTKKSQSSKFVREFYQLAFAGELDANETKQIVRVKLSPGALVQLGAVAPASVLTRSEITADLLLGEDGTPRAIRYVE